MKAKIQQILLFLFIFPATIQSKKSSCPISSCGGSTFLMIKYPFKLQKDQSPNHCQDYINLRCNENGQAVINIPSSGDFIVTYINYYSQKIGLSDPGNCLPRRLMTNFSLYPLEAFRYEDYTYYMCQRNRIIYKFSEINCLSNSTNATVATSRFPRELMEGMYGCKPIVSSKIPAPMMTQYDDLGIYGYDLQLTWNVSGCRHCKDYYGAEKPGDSKSKWAKFFGSSLFIPSAVVLATFFGIASFLRMMKLIAVRADSNSTTANNSTADATGTQLSATNTTNGAANRTENSSEIKSCTELVVLSESQGTSIHSGVPCSICLEEYHGKDRVRFLVQCGHCFHAECIDQWLQKNTTCPVCRSSLSKF